MRILQNIAYNPQNTGDLYLPDTESASVVLMIHGGGWTSMDRTAMDGVADFLCRNGLAVFNIDYSLAPQKIYPAGLNDCKDAAKWLLNKENHYAGFSELFILGASAGGYYAMMTGLTLAVGHICGIISVSGINDVYADFRFAPDRYELLLGHRPAAQELEKINPATYFTDKAPPVLCTHSRNDEVVPFAVTLDFEQKVSDKKSQITLYKYDLNRIHQGHAIWIPDSHPHKLYPDIEKEILQFIHKTLHDRRNSNVKN